MAQAPSKWFGYYQVINDLLNGLWNFGAGHQFNLALFTAASIAINQGVYPATYTAFAADGHEVAAGGGYSTGGVSIGTMTLAALADILSNGNGLMKLANGVWIPTGGGITYRAGVIYDFTDASKRAIAYSLGDSTPADVTALPVAGQEFVISVGTFSSALWSTS